MRPRDVVHNTFEGGEADPQYERRSDADLWQITAKKMRNVRLVNGGGYVRRPGLARARGLDGAARLVEFVSRAGTKRLLAIRDDEIDVIETDETIEATLTGTGIAAADLDALQFTQIDDRIIITSQGTMPQELTWTEATTTFAQADFAFSARNDGSIGQPYFRFRDTRGITIQPDGRTGSITLLADADLFVAGHVGTRFTLHGREVEIDAVTDSTHADATVIQELFPTRELTVGSTQGFSVGHICQDSVGDTSMEVVSIVDGTHLEVILIDTFTDPSTASNQLLGPNGSTTLTAVGAASAEGATVVWKEQLVSALRGYPGGSVVHKDRLIFVDFPAAPEIHGMSVLGVQEDFDVGDGLDDDAIIEGPGDAKGKRVRFVVASEQLVSLTEAGSYYIGEGPTTPLTPASIEFLRIGPEAAGACNPIVVAEGVVFLEANADRLMLLQPTGQLRRAWTATELASVSSEILVSPKRLLLVDGSVLGPERYIFALNSDGTLCVIHYRRDSALTGATLWSTDDGEFVDVALFNNKVYAVVNRGGSHTLERFDNDRLLDCSTLISNVSPNTPQHLSWYDTPGIALVWRKTVSGEARRADLGELYTGDAVNGTLSGAPKLTRDYEGGFRFTPEVVPWPPIDPEVGPGEHQRIASASIDVLRSGSFYAMGQLFSPYRATDDVSEPPPLRTGWRKRKYSGRKRDWDFSLTQEEAAPLQVRAVTFKVR